MYFRLALSMACGITHLDIAVSAQARSSLESVLLLAPKPVDGQTIVQAIGATPGFTSTAETLETVLRGADLDWEDVNYPVAGAGQKGRPSGRCGKGKDYGMIGDGGMYV
jgi:hypothetical protein